MPVALIVRLSNCRVGQLYLSRFWCWTWETLPCWIPNCETRMHILPISWKSLQWWLECLWRWVCSKVSKKYLWAQHGPPLQGRLQEKIPGKTNANVRSWNSWPHPTRPWKSQSKWIMNYICPITSNYSYKFFHWNTKMIREWQIAFSKQNLGFL